MRPISIRNQQGFALPLILGITTMLMIIIMTISDSVYRKVAVVTEFNDRGQADLKVYSAFNESLFNLLVSTVTSTGLQIHVAKEPSAAPSVFQQDAVLPFWNVYGEPISLENGAQVILRDTAGMASPVAYSSNVLQRLAERAQPGSGILLLDVLADWQDNDDFTRLHGAEAWEYRRDNYPYVPRNAPLQCISELRLIKGLDHALYQQLETDLTYWPVHTNYLTMQADMLRAMFDDQALVDQLLALREQGLLTASLFSTMSGMPLDEDTFLFPSNRLQMIVTASVQRARSRIEVVVSKQPAADQPFTIFEWRR